MVICSMSIRLLRRRNMDRTYVGNSLVGMGFVILVMCGIAYLIYLISLAYKSNMLYLVPIFAIITMIVGILIKPRKPNPNLSIPPKLDPHTPIGSK